MKKVLMFAAAMGLAAYVSAGTVNPTSNVLADTAGTANAIVLRDSAGGIDGQQLTNLSISGSRLASSAVSTTQLMIDFSNNKIVCVTTMKQLGFCSGAISSTANGYCSCSTSIP